MIGIFRRKRKGLKAINEKLDMLISILQDNLAHSREKFAAYEEWIPDSETNAIDLWAQSMEKSMRIAIEKIADEKLAAALVATEPVKPVVKISLTDVEEDEDEVMKSLIDAEKKEEIN